MTTDSTATLGAAPGHPPVPATTPAEEAHSFNLSSWTLKHQPLVIFLLALITLFGIISYGRLAQSEDPPFTFRAMVVQAYWPGASAKDVAEQVTDKIERTLQEVPYSDKIRS